MKTLLISILISILLIVSLQVLGLTKEQMKQVKYLEESSYVICKEGYKFLVVTYSGSIGVTQIFETSKYMDSGAKSPQPIKCKGK